MDLSKNCGECGGCPGGAGCGAGSGACGGCGGALVLTEAEIALLRRFGEIPFWPLARRADTEDPVCLEDDAMTPEALSALALKGLIRLDFDLPLTNFDYAPYARYPHHGSMALTAAGQCAVEILEVQGAGD